MPAPTPAQIRLAAVALHKCPGWTDLIVPAVQRTLKKLETTILNKEIISEQDLRDARQRRFALNTLLNELHTEVDGAWKAMTTEEQGTISIADAPARQVFNLEIIRGLQPTPVPVTEHMKVNFPPTPTFNPFGNNPPPAPQREKPAEAGETLTQ